VPPDPVVGDLQVEGLEDLALDLRRRLGQRSIPLFVGYGSTGVLF
jgi:hypothetical protein